jgi:alkylation response protein AidB-like acyl-CoA dehydrogenase
VSETATTHALPEDVEAAREAGHEFARRVLAPRVAQYRAADEYPWDVSRALADASLLGGVIPEEWGGSGLSLQAFVELIEELSTVDHVMAGQAAQASGLLGAGILKFGTDAQKQQYLRPLCEGKRHGSVAMTEPHGGSDVANMKTRATLTAEGRYRLKGQKTFVSHVGESDFFVTFAQTDPAAGRAGICSFLVDRTKSGIEVLPIKAIDVVKPHTWGQVFFDDVDLGPEDMLGGPGDGLRVAMSALEVGRIAVAARACGAARQCLEAAISFARERVVFGKPIAEHQMIQQRIADMATDITAARLLARHAARLKDEGHERVTTEAAMAKSFAAEMMERTASATISILAGHGLLAEEPWGQYLQDAKAFQIAEGTSEIQRVIISRALFGQKGERYVVGSR